jgi:hypothetical protein
MNELLHTPHVRKRYRAELYAGSAAGFLLIVAAAALLWPVVYVFAPAAVVAALGGVAAAAGTLLLGLLLWALIATAVLVSGGVTLGALFGLGVIACRGVQGALLWAVRVREVARPRERLAGLRRAIADAAARWRARAGEGADALRRAAGNADPAPVPVTVEPAEAAEAFDEDDRRVELALLESFPASDPPGYYWREARRDAHAVAATPHEPAPSPADRPAPRSARRARRPGLWRRGRREDLRPA